MNIIRLQVYSVSHQAQTECDSPPCYYLVLTIQSHLTCYSNRCPTNHFPYLKPQSNIQPYQKRVKPLTDKSVRWWESYVTEGVWLILYFYENWSHKMILNGQPMECVPYKGKKPTSHLILKKGMEHFSLIMDMQQSTLIIQCHFHVVWWHLWYHRNIMKTDRECPTCG